MKYQVQTLKQQPDLLDNLKNLGQNSWPDFIMYGDRYSWDVVYKELSDFILLLTDQQDQLLGAGFTVPVFWSEDINELPSTIENIIKTGLKTELSFANTLIPIAALVDKNCQGQNLSSEVLKQMKHLALKLRLKNMVVPVRPVWKTRYPLQRIKRYVNWFRDDGLFYDPWMRTHQKLGAEVLKCVDCTLKIEGTVEEWERWTGMIFPESGEYVVPAALQPVQIDVDSDTGIYREPNVWMQHPI